MRSHLSSRFAKNISVVAAALAVVGVTAGTAAAEGSTNCSGQAIVDRPGRHPVEDAPAHQGGITLSYRTSGAPVIVGQPWQFTLSEWNGSGADYRNVAVTPSFFGWTEVAPGKADGMTAQNTHLEALVDGVWRNVPLQTGCDPTLSINSTLLDHSLAAGARWQQTFRLTVDAAVTPKLTSFQFLDTVTADGTGQYMKPGTTPAVIKVVRRTPAVPQQPTTPVRRPARPATPAAPAASATPSSAVPTPAASTAPAAAGATGTATASTTAPALAPVAAVTPGADSAGSPVLVGAGLLAGFAGLVSLSVHRIRRGRRA